MESPHARNPLDVLFPGQDLDNGFVFDTDFNAASCGTDPTDAFFSSLRHVVNIPASLLTIEYYKTILTLM